MWHMGENLLSSSEDSLPLPGQNFKVLTTLLIRPSTPEVGLLDGA